MFSPEMMEAAQKMMSNMKPEDMQRMSQMAANMDPKVMENMMKGMGGAPGGFDAAQMKQASEQMKNMSPEQLRAGMNQAQNQMGAQKSYMYGGADTLKNEGNGLVKAEKYSEALEKYSKALENIQGHAGADVSTLRLSLLNNSALCHLKNKHFGEAMTSCEEALKADSKNFKALFRRGQAQAGLGNFAEAVLDVREASELQPSDRAIGAELTQLRAKLKDEGIDESSLVRKKHEVSAAWQEPAASSSSSRAPAPDGAGDSDRWSKAASALAENPDMLKQATDAMSNMRPEDLERMMANQPLPPGVDAATMKSQMEQIQKNPDMLKSAMESLQAMPEEQRKQMLASRYGAASGGGAGVPAAMAPGGNPAEAAAAMFDNPDMLQQAVGMAQGMSDDDMRRMGISSKEEGDAMREAAQQMAANPEMAKQMSAMLKNMSPDQMESMMNMSAKMRGGGGGGPGPGGAPGAAAGGPPGQPDADAMAKMMNDPDMVKAAEDMMKNMTPEMLQSMAKASGMELDEGKAKMVTKALPFLMKLMRLFSYLRRAWTAMWSSKRIVIAVVVVLIAMIQHYRGW